MSETSEVIFRSSMNRLPQGGIIATKACGRMIRRSACSARHVERGRRLPLAAGDAADGAAHDLGAVGADVEAEGQDGDGEGLEGDAECGSTKKSQKSCTSAEVPRKISI